MERDFSLVMISLLKGIVYADENPSLWQKLLSSRAALCEYAAKIGLEAVVFEDEGFAWLRNTASDAEGTELPRLVQRRQLSYPVSLLLALFRRRMVENDTSGGGERLIMTRDEIVDMLRTFIASGTNEAKLVDQIDSYINKVIELGFVRKLKADGAFEVRRVLKAFVDAQWLAEFDAALQKYKTMANADMTETANG